MCGWSHYGATSHGVVIQRCRDSIGMTLLATSIRCRYLIPTTVVVSFIAGSIIMDAIPDSLKVARFTKQGVDVDDRLERSGGIGLGRVGQSSSWMHEPG